MTYTKYNWEQYLEMLKAFKYTEEQIAEVEKVKLNFEEIPKDMFDELVRQGVIKRMAKLKKIRTLFVNELGEIIYLNHYNKRYEVCGKFKDESDD